MLCTNFCCKQNQKYSLFDDLQQALDEIPPNEPYVMLGDFNAHVGSSSLSATEDQWDSNRDLHGFGEVNDAGKELLQFLTLNEATVCNTWFEKKDIYKGTLATPQIKVALHRLCHRPHQRPAKMP